MLLAISVISLFFTLSANSLAATTATEEWNISADKILHFDTPKSIVAKGNVILKKREKLAANFHRSKSAASSWQQLLEEPPPKTISAKEAETLSAPQYKTTITINADWIAYDIENKKIKAKGHLRIATSEDELRATSGTLDLKTETGEFREAIIVREQNALHLEGAVIAKTGYNTYKIDNGWAVTCKVEDGETPPWSIASSTTRVTPGGYAVLTNARFRIHKVPVFYTPYLILPVKNTRQTGLLFPELSFSSSGGFSAGLPLFINISDSADITLYPTYFAQRGFMGGAEFRYITGEQNHGMLVGNYLHDELSDPSEVDYYSDTGYTHTNQNRYWLRGKANHTFADGWISRLDLDVVSDEDYLREFDFGSTGFSKTQDRYLEQFGRGFENDTDQTRKNTIKVLKDWGDISFEGQLLAIDDLNPERRRIITTVRDSSGKSTQKTELTTDLTVKDKTSYDPATGITTEIKSEKIASPLWKLPELDLNGTTNTGFADITFDWNANYVYYWREEGIGGSRIDLRPSLSAPIPITPYLESRAKFSLRNTYYTIQENGESKWNEDKNLNRFYPELELNLATTLQRDFNFTSPLRHELRPFIKYFYIPEIDDEEKFPQWDLNDSVAKLNQITYGVDNLFSEVFQGSAIGLEKLHTKASLLVQQSYNLDNDEEPFSDIFTKLSWTPLSGTAVNYKMYYDVYDHDFNSHNFEGIHTVGNTHVGMEYSYDKKNEIEQLNSWIKTRFLGNWLLAGRLEYSLANEETNVAKGSLSYQAQCWAVTFETRYTPEDISYMILFNLANIGASLGFGL